MSDIVMIGAPIEEGTGRAGCRLGPAALRAAGMVDALGALGHRVIDSGDLILPQTAQIAHPNPAIKALPAIAAWTASIAAIIAALPASAVPLVLGGDHSVAAGSLPALNRRAADQGRKLFVLWLDAHSDFHTLDTTESGNLHGVPLAYAIGRPGFEGYFPPNRAPLDPARLCLMGLRSVDPTERSALGAAGVTVHEMPQLRAAGATTLLRAFLGRVERERGVIHLSLDVDFLDPGIAPGVGTAVAQGPGLQEAFAMMRMLAASRLVQSLEIAELNPLLDQDGRTARLMVDLAATALARPFVPASNRSLETCLPN